MEELTHSATAVQLGLDNTPPPAVVSELRATAAMLQRIRDYLSELRGRDTPMFDISWYRALAVNRAVGSSDTSDHPKGKAGDFKAVGVTPIEVCRALLPKMDEFGIEQLINERTWVHVGRGKQSRAVNRVLTIDGEGTRVGIVPVRA